MVLTGKRLENKVAIITGAANGIGRGIALRYALEGAKVVVNDVNQAAAEAVVREIAAAGGSGPWPSRPMFPIKSRLITSSAKP